MQRGSAHRREDTKDPDNIVPYVTPATPDAVDWMQFFCMCLGFAAFLLKVKYLSWMTIYVCVIWLATTKSSPNRQTISTIAFSVIGLLSSYAQPS
eukprot:m.108130 g.108130  ORF g.108130 m.108130 type:complete len:95 (+) comp51722_c0_seq1:113-397(+)